MKSICFIATVPYAINAYMNDHIQSLCNFHHVTVICSGSRDDLILSDHQNLCIINVNIERKISFYTDLVAFFKILKIIKSSRFDVVHSIMPKSGLIGMLASACAGVPFRIHTFTGQVWANKKNIKRFILKTADKLLAACTTHVLTDSPSQKSYLIHHHIVKSKKIAVLGSGSVCGVKTDRFKTDLNALSTIRHQLNIPVNDLVFLYVGRVTKDKGILDLGNAFKLIIKSYSNIHLLIVGPPEDDAASLLDTMFTLNSGCYHRIGFTSQPEKYMAASDILCLPSYREGFGSVIIEAASVGLPSIASNIYGITDAIINEETGILHPPGNISALYSTMIFLIENPNTVKAMGIAAHNRANNYFTTEIVVNAMLDFYELLLSPKC